MPGATPLSPGVPGTSYKGGDALSSANSSARLTAFVNSMAGGGGWLWVSMAAIVGMVLWYKAKK
ncbi:MAG: hypothetical protein SFU99_03920 [Saprospiraceae bacterium]|nr:hypothetical protein [Saprospiraceae bacterium]